VTISVAFAQASYAIDAGETESLIAVVTHDKANGGVKYTVTCPTGVAACGSMTSASSASGVADIYTAPNAVASAEAVTIRATSVADPTKSATEQVVVNPKLALVVPAPVPSPGHVSAAYILDLSQFVQGGTAPLIWAISSGTLPAGLTLNAGRISGTPSGPAVPAIVGFTVSDSGKPAMVVNFSVTITLTTALALTITNSAPPNGTVGASYNRHLVCTHFFVIHCFYVSGFNLNASGGVPPYTWSWAGAAGSSLPPGLALTNNVISGTPTSAGTYIVIVTVSDSESPAKQANANYTITIAP
jgi:hypothetical protein